MADIIYNGAKVIEHARSRKGQSEATAVTWGCSPEFDATRSTEVSFVEDGAFVAIPRPIPRSGSRYIPKSTAFRCNAYTLIYHRRTYGIVENVIKLSRRIRNRINNIIDNGYIDARKDAALYLASYSTEPSVIYLIILIHLIVYVVICTQLYIYSTVT